MNLNSVLIVLRARAWLAGLILATVVLMTIAVSFALPKRYAATANVIVDSGSSDPITGAPQPMALMPSGYLATQVDVLRSERVANRVIQTLGLRDQPVLRGQWQTQAHGRGSFSAWLARLLQSNLDISPSRESNVIAITFSSVDSRFAPLAANAFAQAYIDTSLELKVDPARRNANFFGERVRALRDTLEAAQARLTAYQRQKGISGNTNTLDIETARLAQLSTQLAQAQGDSAMSSARGGVATGSAASSPDVINTGVVQQLRTDAARKAVELEQLSGRLGVAHPQYQQAQAELAEIRRRLAAEERSAASAVAAASRADSQREITIRRSMAEQQRHVLASSSERDALAVLQRDVDTAQKAYDLVGDRLNQSQLQSAVQQTNVALLTPATEPSAPASPNIPLNIALAFFVGGFLAVAAALALEFLDRRIRSSDDLADLGFPVLADLSVQRRPRNFLRLVGIR